jgi:hypothetical protein
VVQSVVGRTVDELFEPMASNHVAIVDKNGPDLNADEEEHVEVLLHGADVDKNAGQVSTELQLQSRSSNLLVGERLDIAVNRVEGNGSPGGRN